MLRSGAVDCCQVPGAPYLSIRGRRAARAEAQQRLKRRCRRAPTVVSKDELVQIDLELAATRAVMGPHQPLLQIADGAIREAHDRLRALAEFAAERLGARHIAVPLGRQTRELLQAIGVNVDPGRCAA